MQRCSASPDQSSVFESQAGPRQLRTPLHPRHMQRQQAPGAFHVVLLSSGILLFASVGRFVLPSLFFGLLGCLVSPALRQRRVLRLPISLRLWLHCCLGLPVMCGQQKPLSTPVSSDGEDGVLPDSPNPRCWLLVPWYHYKLGSSSLEVCGPTTATRVSATQSVWLLCVPRCPESPPISMCVVLLLMGCITSPHEAGLSLARILLSETPRHVKLGCGQVKLLLLCHAGRYLVGYAMVPTVGRGFTVF